MSASDLFAFALLVLPCALVLAALAIALWARRRRRRWRTAWDPSTHKRDEVDAREWRKLYEQQPPPPEPIEPHFAMNADVHRQSLAPRVRLPKLPPTIIHGRDWTDTGGFSFAYGSDGWILLQHLRTAGLRNGMVLQAKGARVRRPGVIALDCVAVTDRDGSRVDTVLDVPVSDIPSMLKAVDELVDSLACLLAQRPGAVSARLIGSPKV